MSFSPLRCLPGVGVAPTRTHVHWILSSSPYPLHHRSESHHDMVFAIKAKDSKKGFFFSHLNLLSLFELTVTAGSITNSTCYHEDVEHVVS